VGLVDLADPTTGTATCAWTAELGSQDSDSFTVGVVVGGYYARNSADDDTVVTVSRPLADSISGGGYLLLRESAGRVPGDDGTKMNAGFTVKRNRSGTNPQGKAKIIVRHAGRVYQIKSNAIASLATDPTAANEATFTGRANIQDVTDPLAPVSVDGNASLQVTLADNGEPGSADALGVTLWNKDGGLWFSSNWSGTATREQALGGGNQVVR
jgi:hypothetical protein